MADVQRRLPLLALLFALSSLACRGDGPSRTGAVEYDSAGIHIVENRGPAAAPLSVRVDPEHPLLLLGAEDGGSDEQFVRIDAVTRTHRGEIVVVDGGALEVRVFGTDGSFFSLGRPESS